MCIGEIYPDSSNRVGKKYFIKESIGINPSLGILPNATFVIKEHRKVLEFGLADKSGESYEILVEPETNVLGGLCVRFEWQHKDQLYHYSKIAFENALKDGRIEEIC